MAINTKLSVSGLAGYKRDLATAKQSVKDLSDELALNEAEFQRDGDKASYLKRKVYILQQQIQAQQSVVEKANTAMQNAATQYGEGSKQAEAFKREVVKGKTALAQMQTRLNETEQALAGVGEQAAGEDGAAGKVSTLQETLQGLAQNVNMETLKKGLGDIADTIAGAAKKAANLAAELWKATTDAGSWADDLLTQSTQTGVDTTTLQQWRYAAQFVDTEADTILAARKRVEKAISGEDLQIGDALIATTDAEGNLRGWEDVMWDAVEALGAMDNETERNQAAMELFGKNYDQMLPLIKAGREQWEKYMADAPTLSEDQVKALGELDDAVNTMNSALEGSKMQLLASLAPVMQTVAEAIAQIAQSLGEYLQTEEGQELLANLGDTLSGIMKDLLSPETIERAFSTMREALDKVSETLGWISEHKDEVVNALKVIGGAFAGLKVSQGVLTFVQLMSSGKGALGNLFGKGAAGAAGNAGMNAGNAAGTGAAAGNLPLLLKGGVVAGAALAYTHGVAALGNTIDKLAGYEDERNRQKEEAENAAAAVAGTTYTDANKAAAAEAFMNIAELWGMVGSGKLGGGITGLRVTERGADNFDYQQGLYDLVDMAHENGLDLRAALGDELGKRVEEYVELSKLADKLNEEGDLFGEDRDRYEELMDAQAGIEWNQLGSVFEQVFDQMSTYLTAVDEMPDQTETDGYNAGVGLANGMRDSIPIVQEAGADLGKAATDAVESTLNINSPSKVMAQLGGYVGQGFALGIEDSLAQVRDASSALSAAAMGGAVARPRTPAAAGAAGLNADALGLALRSALSGVQVNMSGQAVGEIVADTVDEQIGRSAYNARYNV